MTATVSTKPLKSYDDLRKIPDQISVSFLKDHENLSEKVLEKGLNYFSHGYIHEIKIYDMPSTSKKQECDVRVEAKCWRSMQKNEEPHKVQVEIKGNSIPEALCNCKAGLSGRCSHVVGLVKSLQGLKLHNFTHAPENLSCTSLPQQWHIPRGKKIQPVPVNHVVVARPKETRKRKPVLCQIDLNKKLPKVTDSDIKTLKSVKGTPLEYMMHKAPIFQTSLGPMQIGSALSYQTKNMKTLQKSVSKGCGNTSLHNPSPVKLQEEFKQLNTRYSKTDLIALEQATRGQSTSTQWFEERRNRLTASNFGRVLNRKSVPTEKFVKSLFSSKSISVPSLDYGKRNECKAKSKYLSYHPSNHLHECGLVVNKEFLFLGATPDAKVCIDNCKSGIVEIKCPYSVRDCKITAACDRGDFFLQKNQATGKISLKRNHEHYAQVQGQLMVTGCDFCEFIVYTKQDLFVQRITPDISFMESMLKQLSVFFRDHAKPFLVNQTQTALQNT